MYVGSSPHTWRIPTFLMQSLKTVRIISTYVENTAKKAMRKANTRDHLHIRGEYAPVKWLPKNIMGSSPHTWRILEKEE